MTTVRTIGHPLGEAQEVEAYSAPDEALLFASWATGEVRDLKRLKTRKFLDEDIARNQALIPEWENGIILQMIASIWAQIMGTATADQILGHSTHLFSRDTAIPRVQAMTLASELLTVDPSDPDPFGDGTLWPV